MLKIFKIIRLNANSRHLSTQRPILAKAGWAKLRSKKWSTDYALENFDEYYKPVFGERWPSIRLALLSKQKYCAVVNNFSDTTKAESFLQNLGALNIRQDYESRLNEADSPTVRESTTKDEETIVETEETNVESKSEETRLEEDDKLRFFPSKTRGSHNFNEFVPVTNLKGLEDYVDETDYISTFKPEQKITFETVVDKPIPLPHHWKIYTYERGDVRSFPAPRRGDLGVLDYYLMDATSLLPVFALNVKDNDKVLDMCAAPGGKSLAILQTLKSVNLVCNDESLSRMNRLLGILDTYVSKKDTAYKRVTVTIADGCRYENQTDIFNKILVDVPCTTDRHAVTIEDNNLFHPTRMKERVRIPEKQTQLLSAALKAVKIGGSVVYSTCTLSPIQNDGVVHMALRNLWETTSSNFVLHDLKSVFYPFRSLFEFHPSSRYGQLVFPTLPQNFGPMYICKLSKIS